MAVINFAQDKLVTSKTGNLKDALPMDARDMLSRLLKDTGLTQITVSNTAPADKTVIWWHKDVRAFKRWDAVQGNWFAITPDQFGLHMYHRLIRGAVADIILESGDQLAFWDISLGEGKKITFDNLSAQIEKNALVRLGGRNVYVDTSAGPVTSNLPTEPVDRDVRRFIDVGGYWTTNNLTIGRSGKKIFGLSENLIANRKNVGIELMFNAAADDWKVTELFRSAYK